MARKTKYSEEVLVKTNAYIEEAKKETKKLPKAESLALYLDIGRKTIYNWAKEHKEFRRLLKKIKLLQLERLIDDGIYGGKQVNPAIIKMWLVNNHNLKDETSMKLSGEIENKFTDDQISKIAERIASRRATAGNPSSEK